MTPLFSMPGRSVLLLTAVLGCAIPSLVSAADKAEVGKTAPDFTATGIDGKDFKLSDKAGKNKNIVLMFSRAHW